MKETTIDDVKAIRLHLLDGVAEGRIIAKLETVNIVAFRIPKGLLTKFDEEQQQKIKPKEINYCGIYFLLGSEENSGKEKIYVGQVNLRTVGDPLSGRFSSHKKNKSYCNEIVFFTTRDNQYGGTELDYLENRLYHLVKKAHPDKLDNRQAPSMGNIGDLEKISLDEYIKYATILMRVFGRKVLESDDALEPESGLNLEGNSNSIESVELTLTHTFKNKETVKAQAVWNSRDIVVRKGSQIMMENTETLPFRVRSARESLLEEGKLSKDHGSVFILEKSVTFPTSSTAAVFVIGAPANGRKVWRSQADHSKKFEDIEKERSQAPSPKRTGKTKVAQKG